MIKINSFIEFIEIVDSFERMGVIYRGETRASRPLLPSVSRYVETLKFSGVHIEKKEKDSMEIFKAEYKQYCSFNAFNDWELLALAQHHGLPTRLLVWSLSPLIALFFAVEKCYDEDAVVYSVKNESNWIYGSILESLSPFDIKKSQIYMPNQVTPRLRAQQGVFTIQPDISKEFHIDGIEKIIINKDCLKNIKFNLFTYGISKKSIYPDIDGLCSQLKWSHFEGFGK